MPKTIHVKPAGGAPVRFEEAALGDIPGAGAAVPETSYYRRRIAEGSLVETRRKREAAKPSRKES